jgi:hypothetical protein
MNAADSRPNVTAAAKACRCTRRYSAGRRDSFEFVPHFAESDWDFREWRSIRISPRESDIAKQIVVGFT